MTGVVLDDVSDTARWVAYYRALESERPDALFRDPLAMSLAGERGRRMAEVMAKVALPWAIAVRTRVYDELLLESLERDQPTAVLSIGAGMDARPYRLKLPPSLTWIELDLPGIIAVKNAALAQEKPACALERVGVDLRDERAFSDLLDSVVARHESVTVVTEGVLSYLDERTVERLASELHSRPAFRSWVLEAALPEVLERNRRAWNEQFDKAGVTMRFAPTSGIDYFSRYGWAVRSKRSCLMEARRLGREPRFASALHFVKSLSSRGRRWLQDLVVYGVVEPAKTV